MNNNNSLTLIFCAYFSHKHIYRICKSINKKFKIIVVENSLDKKFKKDIEKKYKNTKVIIPKENVSIAKSYNIGIKNSKTKYVYLNSSLDELIDCAEKLKDFCILAPNYKDTSNFNNYVGNDYVFKKTPSKILKYRLKRVDFIDNSFFMLTKKAKKYLFDENYFLYSETMDFCFQLKKFNEKSYVSDKIRFKHYVSDSVDNKYSLISKLTRAWHYNWSKFYYYKKNYNYFFALKKIIPNIVKSVKKIIFGLITFNKENTIFGIVEFYGIICSILNLKSFYRPKM